MTTTPQDHQPPAVKRFGGGKKPIVFYIGDDDFLFTAAPKIPADAMIELVQRNEDMQASAEGESAKTSASYTTALGMFEMVLYSDSLDELKRRMKDRQNPVDIKDLIDIMQWLIGDGYGLRPMPPPSSSGDTSLDDGLNLMDGAPAVESTPEISPGIDSSILPTSGLSAD